MKYVPRTPVWPQAAFLALALGLMALVPGRATIVYDEDFEGGVDLSPWSVNHGPLSIDSTPVGDRHFLGQFGNRGDGLGDQAVNLSLAALPSHSWLKVSFDFFAIKSWDGDQEVPTGNYALYGVGPYGADVFGVDVASGPTLLSTTFSNDGGYGDRDSGWDKTQTFPGSYPGGGPYAARTGAAENNTLGYWFAFAATDKTPRPMDSVYHFEFLFPHVSDTLSVDFWTDLGKWGGDLANGLGDEAWGLDNVRVETAVPEPGTLALLGCGMGLLWKRRRRA